MYFIDTCLLTLHKCYYNILTDMERNIIAQAKMLQVWARRGNERRNDKKRFMKPD